MFNGSNYSSGNLGTGAVCRETTTSIALPAKVNGGYCFQATAGGYDHASFNSW